MDNLIRFLIARYRACSWRTILKEVLDDLREKDSSAEHEKSYREIESGVEKQFCGQDSEISCCTKETPCGCDPEAQCRSFIKPQSNERQAICCLAGTQPCGDFAPCGCGSEGRCRDHDYEGIKYQFCCPSASAGSPPCGEHICGCPKGSICVTSNQGFDQRQQCCDGAFSGTTCGRYFCGCTADERCTNLQNGKQACCPKDHGDEVCEPSMCPCRKDEECRVDPESFVSSKVCCDKETPQCGDSVCGCKEGETCERLHNEEICCREGTTLEACGTHVCGCLSTEECKEIDLAKAFNRPGEEDKESVCCPKGSTGSRCGVGSVCGCLEGEDCVDGRCVVNEGGQGIEAPTPTAVSP